MIRHADEAKNQDTRQITIKIYKAAIFYDNKAPDSRTAIEMPMICTGSEIEMDLFSDKQTPQSSERGGGGGGSADWAGW